MKFCRKCETNLSLDFFGSDKSRKSGKSIYCLKCRADLAREKRNKRPHVDRNYRRLIKYNLSPDQYQEILKSQGGVCSICKTDTPGAGHPELYVDHNHSTGQVRGLLCRDCNLLLGYAKDNPENLRRSILYLERWKPVSEYAGILY